MRTIDLSFLRPLSFQLINPKKMRKKGYGNSGLVSLLSDSHIPFNMMSISYYLPLQSRDDI